MAINVMVESHVEDVKTELAAAIERALERIGLRAERNAKTYCPVDTGRLRNSISHEEEFSGTTFGGGTVYIGTNVEYAPYVELGTRYQKAQPYLAPAIENHISEYQELINEAFLG